MSGIAYRYPCMTDLRNCLTAGINYTNDFLYSQDFEEVCNIGRDHSMRTIRLPVSQLASHKVAKSSIGLKKKNPPNFGPVSLMTWDLFSVVSGLLLTTANLYTRFYKRLKRSFFAVCGRPSFL